MEERGLVGIEARTASGDAFGRISEVVVDEDGAITHVIVERDDGGPDVEMVEVPITSLSLDRDADFATFHADPSDDEPGDHLGDEEAPQGYAPNQSDAKEDTEHDGQFVTTPTDPDEAVSLDAQASTEADEAGGWQDEAFTTAESGYPRTDAYIDPDTGDEEVDPLLKENETLKDDADDLLVDTGLRARRAQDGVVELTGSAATREDLDAVVQEIMGLDEVRDVDTTDVDVG